MNIWATILGMALVTYGARLLPLALLDVEKLPAWFRRGLPCVPIAVLTAQVTRAYLLTPSWGVYV